MKAEFFLRSEIRFFLPVVKNREGGEMDFDLTGAAKPSRVRMWKGAKSRLKE
jgi:hypothetical protein